MVIAASPLIGSILAAIFLDEPLTPAILVGVLAVSAGVALIAREVAGRRVGGDAPSLPWHALLVAAVWGFTPVMIRRGLEDLPAPLIGVAIGMIAASSTAYAIVRLGWRPRAGDRVREVLPWILASGTIVGLAITSQWQAFEAIEISIAITLFQLSTPVVVVAAPLIARAPIEAVTPAVIAGMVAVVGGSVLVVLSGGS